MEHDVTATPQNIHQSLKAKLRRDIKSISIAIFLDNRDRDNDILITPSTYVEIKSIGIIDMEIH